MKKVILSVSVFLLCLFVFNSLFAEVVILPKQRNELTGTVRYFGNNRLKVSIPINENTRHLVFFRLDKDTLVDGIISEGAIVTVVYILKKLNRYRVIRLAKEIHVKTAVNQKLPPRPPLY